MNASRITLPFALSGFLLFATSGCQEAKNDPPMTIPAVELESRLVQSYQTSCKVCHESAAAGAPLSHVVEAWQPRLEKGRDTLLKNTMEGTGGMPPMGQCYECTEEDLKLLIEYMAAPTKKQP